MEALRRELNEDGESVPHRNQPLPHAITPGTFIFTAIQIEEQQYVVSSSHPQENY